MHTLESLGVSSARLAHHADEISDPDERPRVYAAGIRDYYTTNFRLASRLAETANALAAQANDVLAKLDLRLLTGVLAHSRGEAHEAMRIVLETEKDARAQGILLMVARCNMFLVVRESDRGDFAAAAQRAEQCANIFRGLNDTRSLGSALFLMGFCLQQVNRLDESTQAYEEAATTYQSLGQMALYTMVQSYISNQLTSQGRFDEAETVARAALGIAERLGFSNSISELHLVLGELARQRFDLTSARLAYLEALKWLRICGKAATEVVELNLMMVNVADPSRKIEDQDLQRLREVFANRSNLRFIQTIEAIEDLQHGRPIREDGSNADVRWLVAVQKSRSLP